MGSRIDLAIVCDFDGTVALADVGNAFFKAFARPPWEHVVREWEEGRIGSKECLEKECALTRATTSDLREFALCQTIDPCFADIVGWARDHFVPFCIVSDGFREYIRIILSQYELDVPTFANRVEFEDRRLRPMFPYYGLGCSRCANCKGYHVRRFRQAGYRTIFIGDGLSDLCALSDSDIIIAKDALAEHCRRENIHHEPVDDLRGALAVLRKFENS